LNNNTQQNSGIELLRVFSIILLILYHTSIIGNASEYPSVIDKFLKLIHMGWVGTDFFLTIAGYFSAFHFISREQKPKLSSYYIQRLTRIFPSYYIFLAVHFTIVLFIINSLGKPMQYTSEITPWLLSFSINHFFATGKLSGVALEALFSIAILVQLYVVYSWMFSIIKRTNIIIFILAISWIVAIILRFQMQTNGYWYIYFSTFTRMDPFILGSLLALILHQTNFGELLNKYSGYIFIVSLSFFLLIIMITRGFWVEHALTIPVAFPFIAIFCAATLNFIISNPINGPVINQIASLGKYTFAIYLFKIPVVYILYKVMNNYLILPSEILAKLMLVIFSIPLCFLIGAIWYWLIENPINEITIKKRHL